MTGLRYESLADIPEGMRPRKKPSKYHNDKIRVDAIRYRDEREDVDDYDEEVWDE